VLSVRLDWPAQQIHHPVQLNSPSQSPSEAVMSLAAGPAPVIHHHQFSHPAAIFNQFVVSLVDHSLLKLCQDGDVGTLSRYLALHHDKVPARSLNAVDATGKVNKKFIKNNQRIRLCWLIFILFYQISRVCCTRPSREMYRLPVCSSIYPDVNLADNEGNTALHLAAQAGITKSNQALSICNWLDIHEMSCRSRRYRQSTHVVS
jgi:hypothetical protein